MLSSCPIWFQVNAWSRVWRWARAPIASLRITSLRHRRVVRQFAAGDEAEVAAGHDASCSIVFSSFFIARRARRDCPGPLAVMGQTIRIPAFVRLARRVTAVRDKIHAVR